MTTTADTEWLDDTPEQKYHQKHPGDFWRWAHSDLPVVTDPTGRTVRRWTGNMVPNGKTIRSGEMAGQPMMVKEMVEAPRLVTHGRMSGITKILDDTESLMRYRERMALMAAALHATTETGRAELDGLLAALNDDPLRHKAQAWKSHAAGMVARLNEAAGVNTASSRGTAMHAAIEAFAGGIIPSEIIDELLDLGCDEATARACVQALVDCLDGRFEIVACEFQVSVDTVTLDDGRTVVVNKSGTCDAILRALMPMSLTCDNGKTFNIDTGDLLIDDHKTGDKILDGSTYADGRPKHKYDKRGYAGQAWGYAHGVPVTIGDSPEEMTRDTWEERFGGRPRRDVALITHIEVARAIATGEAVCSIIPIDLRAAEADVLLALEVDKRNIADKFFGRPVMTASVRIDQVTTMSPRPLPPVSDDFDPFAGIDGRGPVQAETPAEVPQAKAAEPMPLMQPWDQRIGDDKFRAYLVERVKHLHASGPAAFAAFLAEFAGTGIPKFSESDQHTNGELRVIEQLLGRIEYAHAVDGYTVTVPPVSAPDEGATVGRPDIDAARVRYEGLPSETRARVDAWAIESSRAGLSLSLAPDNGVQSARRLSSLDARIAVALIDDDVIRAAIAFLVGEEWPLMPSLPLGAVLGACSEATNRSLAEMAPALAAHPEPLTFDVDGRLRLNAA